MGRAARTPFPALGPSGAARRQLGWREPASRGSSRPPRLGWLGSPRSSKDTVRGPVTSNGTKDRLRDPEVSTPSGRGSVETQEKHTSWCEHRTQRIHFEWEHGDVPPKSRHLQGSW